MELKTLNDVLPNWMSGNGIFSVLQSFPVPWKDNNIASALDLEYHGNVSGEKFISPLLRKLMSGETLSEMEQTLVGTTIMAICGVNWGKQWETITFDYNPIENYSMTELMTNDETVNKYGKTRTNQNNNLIHGFNSTTGISSDEQTENGSDGGSDTQTRNYQLKRSGNIGVTTSQQMIESEHNLWLWNYFREVIFPDLDRVLTIPIY